MNNTQIYTSGVRLTEHKKHVTPKQIATKAVLYFVLCVLTVFLLFPFVLMVNRGLMSNAYILDPEVHYFPDGIHLRNYLRAFGDGGYLTPLLYSVLVCGITCVAVPLSSFLPAYAFSKLEWIGQKAVFAVMMFTSLIPGIVTQVPLFVLYTNIGFTNTLYPLFVPSLFFSGAMNVFLTRQFLLGVPREMEDSARLDGAGPLRRCFLICAPLCKSILIYMGVNTFIAQWGDYLSPSIYITSEEAPYTFAYALYLATSKRVNAAHPEWIFAAATVMSIVPAVLFGFFQKYLIEGIASAGIKG